MDLLIQPSNITNFTNMVNKATIYIVNTESAELGSKKNFMKTLQTDITKVEKLTEQISKKIRGGEVFGLVGNLGSGKTTFTQSLAKKLGVKQHVTSPTFTLMQQYQFLNKQLHKLPLYFYHLDLYRTQSFQEVTALGVTQIWEHPQTVTIIEWADKFQKNLPANTTLIIFKDNDGTNKD